MATIIRKPTRKKHAHHGPQGSGTIRLEPKQYVPNKARAVTEGFIATIHQGRRIIRRYRAGEKLLGHIQQPSEVS